MSQSYLSNIINGKRRPSWDTAKRLADVFGNDPSWWMEAGVEEKQALLKGESR
mgnify:CR=1 FL=1